MQSHSSACPCRILRVALHSPHLPLILSIVPFLCETMDSRAVAYYSPVPHTPLTSSPRTVSWSEVSQKMIAPPHRHHDEKRTRTREETPISWTCVFTFTTCNAPLPTRMCYFAIKYTLNAMCISKPQGTRKTRYKVLK